MPRVSNPINDYLSTWPQFALQIEAFVVKSENRLAVWVILEIFWTVSLKAHDWSSWIYIEWVQFVLKNYEILHFVRGLYDKQYCFTSRGCDL